MATYKYLDSTGLEQVWSKIKENTPHPDWNENDDTSADYITNKPPIKAGTGTNSIIIGNSDNIASGVCSIASGYQNISSNKYSIAFGETSKASGQDSVAIGAFLNLGTITLTGSASSLTYTDTATNQSTVDLLKRYGQSLFVWVNNKPIRLTNITSNENLLITFTFESTLSEEAITAVDYTLYAANIATGVGAMAFGHANRASGQNAFVFGTSNASTGTASFVEGKANEASNNQSHAEGFGTKSTGKQSHSEGRYTIAAGERSHAQGEYTTANGYAETTIGRYNALSNSTAQTSYNVTNSPYILVAGNGTADNARSNAYTLDWSGNGWYAGKLTIGTAPTNDMDVATKKYVDDATSGITSDLAGLTDTTITSPTNGQALVYDSTSSKWVNGDIDFETNDEAIVDAYLHEGTKVSFSELIDAGIYSLNTIIFDALAFMDSDGHYMLNTSENYLPSYTSLDGKYSLRYNGGTGYYRYYSPDLDETTYPNGYMELYPAEKWDGFSIYVKSLEIPISDSNSASMLISEISAGYIDYFSSIGIDITASIGYANSTTYYKLIKTSSTNSSGTWIYEAIFSNGINTITVTDTQIPSSAPSDVAGKYKCSITYNNFDDIDDVEIDALTLSDSQIITYDETNGIWVNSDLPTIPTASSTTPSADGTGAVGTAITYARADHVHPKITQTISISSNVITLTGSDGTTSSVTLPVYNGGVSSS